MQKLILSLLIFTSSTLVAQITDTIEVSFTKSVYLIFPEATNYDRGSEDVLIKNPETLSLKKFLGAIATRSQELALI